MKSRCKYVNMYIKFRQFFVNKWICLILFIKKLVNNIHEKCSIIEISYNLMQCILLHIFIFSYIFLVLRGCVCVCSASHENYLQNQKKKCTISADYCTSVRVKSILLLHHILLLFVFTCLLRDLMNGLLSTG